jgi:hypothetical protein
MRRLGIAGFLVILSVSGCASMKGTATSEEPRAAQVPLPADSAPPPPASTPPSKAESSADNGSDQSSTPAKTPDAAAPPPTPPPPPPPPASPASRSSSAKAKTSGDARPVKQTGAAAAQTRQSGSSPAPLPASPSPQPAPPPASAPTASPTLNLADLEQRLRETRAIGVFTKLSLKNQVDDLLNAFRDLYRGPNKHPSAELRQRYDLLLLKVLTLLQDGDPPLAAAIASSREAIWSILADPDKFAKI